MVLSRWLCAKSTKNMVVKIVHPGGNVELHDRPVLAVEVMPRNPKCVVAYPNVFREPWAIVTPETMLSLGYKFYVVPKSTVRKLQRMSYKHSPHPMHQSSASEEKEISSVSSTCWFRKISNIRDGCSFSDDKCFKGLISGSKTKGQESDDTKEGREHTKKTAAECTKESPKRFSSFDH